MRSNQVPSSSINLNEVKVKVFKVFCVFLTLELSDRLAGALLKGLNGQPTKNRPNFCSFFLSFQSRNRRPDPPPLPPKKKETASGGLDVWFVFQRVSDTALELHFGKHTPIRAARSIDLVPSFFTGFYWVLSGFY